MATLDKAGQQYWERNWANAPPPVLFIPDGRLRNYRNRVLAETIGRAFSSLAKGSTIIEAGCADSTLLPYLASVGFRIAGIDYSPIGCDKIRAHLNRFGLQAEIQCADVFTPPSPMRSRYDGLVSIGLVEHFEKTSEIVSALAALLRSGGRMLTVIPNLQGLVGIAQKLVGPEILRVHQIMSAEFLAHAHRDAGLEVIEYDYQLPVGFGALNYQEPAPRAVYLARRVLTGVLARLSMAAWAIDRNWKLPATSWLSPFAYVIAEKRQTAPDREQRPANVTAL